MLNIHSSINIMHKLNIIPWSAWDTPDIYYSFWKGIFSDYLVASTDIWVSAISLGDDRRTVLEEMKKRFRGSKITEMKKPLHELVDKIFNWKVIDDTIPLHIAGTDFQMSVWKALLTIPKWKNSSYGKIALKIGNPRAVRAVGTAVGSNPIGYVIPCHRVFRSDGWLGGFHWGIDKKKALLAYEGIE